MIAYIKQMLSNKSEVSAMRAMSFIALIVGSIIAAYGIYRDADLGGLAELVGVFLAAAFGGKVAQKHIESKAKDDKK